MIRLCVIWRCEERRNGLSGDQHDIDKNYLGRRNNGTYIFDATSARNYREKEVVNFLKVWHFLLMSIKSCTRKTEAFHPFILFTIYV